MGGRSCQWGAILGLALKPTSVRKAGKVSSGQKGFKTLLPSPDVQNPVAQGEKAAFRFEDGSSAVVRAAHSLRFLEHSWGSETSPSIPAAETPRDGAAGVAGEVRPGRGWMATRSRVHATVGQSWRKGSKTTSSQRCRQSRSRGEAGWRRGDRQRGRRHGTPNVQ